MPEGKTDKHRELREQLRRRIEAGESIGEVASEAGLRPGRVREMLDRVRPQRESLDCEAWLRYLDTHLLEYPDEGLRLNGTPLKEKHTRALFRWRHEGGWPSFFLADELLTHCGLHINDFFQFCRDNDLNPWACGEAPEWEEGFSAS